MAENHAVGSGWIVRRPDGTFAWHTLRPSPEMAQFAIRHLCPVADRDASWRELEAQGSACVRVEIRVIDEKGGTDG